MKRISVAMISYQGEKYIEEQLDSILAILGPKDEVIIPRPNKPLLSRAYDLKGLKG